MRPVNERKKNKNNKKGREEGGWDV